MSGYLNYLDVRRAAWGVASLRRSHFSTMNWSVPREWPGSTVYILGGGPSLKDIDVSRLKGQRIIATNCAFILAPWADCLAWSDPKWFELESNRLGIQAHQAKFKITWRPMCHIPAEFDVKTLGMERGTVLSKNPQLVAGSNSGHSAINLAMHFGARRIVLLGFDMKPKDGENNWHRYHLRPTPVERYKTFIAEMDKAAPLLEADGAEVWNCCPDSALTCFPIVSFDEALHDLPVAGER